MRTGSSPGEVHSKSLSARRAWIEIASDAESAATEAGRSPQGERGLKLNLQVVREHLRASLSARRAWIEIDPVIQAGTHAAVALRKESVD